MADQDKPFWDSSPVPNAEIEAAGDAMRILSESPSARASGGVSWMYLAQVALEAALLVRSKNTHEPPERQQ